jgi:hypothetical protein
LITARQHLPTWFLARPSDKSAVNNPRAGKMRIQAKEVEGHSQRVRETTSSGEA